MEIGHPHVRVLRMIEQRSALFGRSFVIQRMLQDLAQVRLAREYPPLGKRSFACPQADLELRCEEEVLSTLNPYFRRIEVSVYEASDPARRMVKLTQVVSSAR